MIRAIEGTVGPALKTPSEAAVRAWTRLNRAQRGLIEAMEAALKRAGFPPLAIYDALLELWRAPDGRLRQGDLERTLLFPQYSISRLVDRLENAGLARRERCAEDARAYWVVITPAGLALRATIWPVYADAIARHVGDRLSTAEATALADMLERLYGPGGGIALAGADGLVDDNGRIRARVPRAGKFPLVKRARRHY